MNEAKKEKSSFARQHHRLCAVNTSHVFSQSLLFRHQILSNEFRYMFL